MARKMTLNSQSLVQRGVKSLQDLGLTRKEVRVVIQAIGPERVDDALALYGEANGCGLRPGQALRQFHRASKAGSWRSATRVLETINCLPDEVKLSPKGMPALRSSLVGACMLIEMLSCRQSPIPGSGGSVAVALQQAGIDFDFEEALP